MKERIVRLINSIQDPFATEIRYHEKCWLKYVTNNPGRENFHMEKVDLQTAKNFYFSHVQIVIFEEHEISTVQGLLADYKTIVGNYGFSTGCIRSSSIKELLMDEFGERIGFHTRPQSNLSELVYENSGGGSYIEAALM